MGNNSYFHEGMATAGQEKEIGRKFAKLKQTNEFFSIEFCRGLEDTQTMALYKNL